MNQLNRSKLYVSSLLICGLAPMLRAETPVYPGPSYDSATQTGGTDAETTYTYGNQLLSAGQSIGIVEQFNNGTFQGTRGIAWDASGNFNVLTPLSTDSSGASYSTPMSIGPTLQIAGISAKYVNGVSVGDRAVRWDYNGTILELDTFGTRYDGVTTTGALSINASGNIAGYSEEWVAGTSNGIRPAKWNYAGQATELNLLSTTSWNYGNGRAYAINQSGQTCGYSEKYLSNLLLGERPVRWSATGAITELPILGTSASGQASGRAVVMNVNGAAAGYMQKFTANVDKGLRPAMWDAAGNIVELGTLGVSSTGVTNGIANSIDDSGNTVGYLEKYVSGVDKGTRAVRWDALGNASELVGLGTDSSGVTHGEAYAINSLGQVAGYVEKYNSGTYLGRRAMIWQADGNAIDLNNLVASTKWTFNIARSITPSGWVSGVGTYDPDAGGPQPSYARLFTVKITNDVIWTNAAGGDWSTGANWSTGSAPPYTLSTTFNLPNTYTVNFPTNTQIGGIGQTTGNITYALNNHTLTSSEQIVVSSGSLTLNNGTVKARGLICNAALTLNHATVEMTGPGDDVGVIYIKQLNITPNATGYESTIQLHANDLVLDYIGRPSEYDKIVGLVRSGLSLLGGNQTGIASDVVDDNIGSGKMLAVVDNGAIDGQVTAVSGFLGYSPQSVIVKFTWFGDCNFDGVVNGTDYALVDSGFTSGGDLQGWVFGDFNYDGETGAPDYALIDTGFLMQAGTLPEPATLGLPLALSWSLLRRRSRDLAR